MISYCQRASTMQVSNNFFIKFIYKMLIYLSSWIDVLTTKDIKRILEDQKKKQKQRNEYKIITTNDAEDEEALTSKKKQEKKEIEELSKQITVEDPNTKKFGKNNDASTNNLEDDDFIGEEQFDGEIDNKDNEDDELYDKDTIEDLKREVLHSA
jgi:hypothetical protein